MVSVEHLRLAQTVHYPISPALSTEYAHYTSPADSVAESAPHHMLGSEAPCDAHPPLDLADYTADTHAALAAASPNDHATHAAVVHHNATELAAGEHSCHRSRDSR